MDYLNQLRLNEEQGLSCTEFPQTHQAFVWGLKPLTTQERNIDFSWLARHVDTHN